MLKPRNKKSLIEYLRGLGSGAKVMISLEVSCNARPEDSRTMQHIEAAIHKAQTNALALSIPDYPPGRTPAPFWFTLGDDKQLNADYEFADTYWRRSTCAYKGTANERKTVLTFHYL